MSNIGETKCQPGWSRLTTRGFVLAILIALVFPTFGHSLVAADTIWYRNPWDNADQILASDVWISRVDRDPGGHVTGVQYHYCDPDHEQTIATRHVSRVQGGALRVQLTERQARRQLFDVVVSGGLRAKLTDQKGAVVDVWCVRASYDWPGMAEGHVLLPTDELRREDAILRLKLPDETVKEMPFGTISTIEFVADKRVRVRSKAPGEPALDGEWSGKSGTSWIGGMRVDSTVHLEGLSSDGRILRRPVAALRKIEFVNPGP